MAIIGADVPALRNFVSTLLGRASKIEKTKNQLTTVIRDLPWVGNDREQFLNEWNQIHHPSLIRLIDDMRNASKKASHHADAQDAASKAVG